MNCYPKSFQLVVALKIVGITLLIMLCVAPLALFKAHASSRVPSSIFSGKLLQRTLPIMHLS